MIDDKNPHKTAAQQANEALEGEIAGSGAMADERFARAYDDTRRALMCLRLEVPGSVAYDVQNRVLRAVRAALDLRVGDPDAWCRARAARLWKDLAEVDAPAVGQIAAALAAAVQVGREQATSEGGKP